jgi:hypothetical protein
MELDASLSWLALALTPGLAARLTARLLKEFVSPDEVFPGAAAAFAALQSAGRSGAGGSQEAGVQTRRERAGFHVAHRSVPAIELN